MLKLFGLLPILFRYLQWPQQADGLSLLVSSHLQKVGNKISIVYHLHWIKLTAVIECTKICCPMILSIIGVFLQFVVIGHTCLGSLCLISYQKYVKLNLAQYLIQQISIQWFPKKHELKLSCKTNCNRANQIKQSTMGLYKCIIIKSTRGKGKWSGKYSWFLLCEFLQSVSVAIYFIIHTYCLIILKWCCTLHKCYKCVIRNHVFCDKCLELF